VDGSEEADEVGISAEINRRSNGLGLREGARRANKPATGGAAKVTPDSLLGALPADRTESSQAKISLLHQVQRCSAKGGNIPCTVAAVVVSVLAQLCYQLFLAMPLK